MANYNEPISIHKHQIINFPDFSIEWTGEGTEPLSEKWVKDHPGGKTHFGYDYFTLKSKTTQLDFKYTGGLGLYGPLPIEFEGRRYVFQFEPGPGITFSIRIAEEKDNRLFNH